MTPSIQPTMEEHFIGDYKISAINSSHGNWLLCDGSFIDSTNYPQLFGVIGHNFGSFSAYPSLFQLPNVTDDVIGISGDLNSIGTEVGSEEITLTENNLPLHSHHLATNLGCNGDNEGSFGGYLAVGCTNSPWISQSDNYYTFRSQSSPPNIYRSASVGNNEPLNIMQPTAFIGNLFIYAG